MPSVAEGREVHDVDWKSELQRALRPYGIDFVDLPDEVKRVLENRQRFTIVEGENPIDFYRGRIDAQNLIQKVLRHDQSTLAVQQMKIYAIHNGITQNDREPLQLEAIKSYPGLEGPYVHRIPDELLDEDGVTQTTIQGGTQLPGRLILWTSEHNMPARHKVLRPRWRLSYRSSREMLGSKSVSEIAPATPGAIQSLEQSIRFCRNWTNVWTSDVKNRDCSSSNHEEDAITPDDQMPNGYAQFFALRRERAGQRH
jgi:hypothetical protein